MKKITFLNKQRPALNAANLNQMQSNVEEVFNGEEAMGSIVVEDVECKNLFNKNGANKIDGYFNGSTPTIQSGDGLISIYIPCEPNTTYTVQKILSSRFMVGYTTEVPALNITARGVIEGNNATEITITTDSNANYLCAFVYHGTHDSSLETILNSIQIEKGSTATEYTPYKKFGYNSQESMGKIVVDDITSSNLFNPNDLKFNKWLDINGQETSGVTNDVVTNFIKVQPNTKYTISGFSSTEQWLAVCSYNSSKAFNNMIILSQASGTPTISFTTSATDEYIRCAFNQVNLGNETLQIEKGDATSYKPYKQYGHNSKESMGKIVVDDISCKNLFNIGDITPQWAIYGNNEGSSATLTNTSGYMPVKAGQQYTFSYDYSSLASEGDRSYIFYNSNKEFLHTLTYNSANKEILMTPTQDGYVRISYDINCYNIQFEKGTKTSYTPYKEFSNLQHYSTNEQVVGTWIDGKPLYRKVVNYANALVAGNNAIAHNISNMGVVTKTDGYTLLGTTYYRSGALESSTKFLNIKTVDATYINIQVGSDWGSSFKNGFVTILEYTKTTDTAVATTSLEEGE